MNPAIQSLFISSTSLDLAEEREAVSRMLCGLRQSGFLGREHFGGRETPGRRASIEEIEKSQLYILLLGGVYGSGVIEDEYRRARDRGIPCLIYFKHVESEGAHETDPERAQRLSTFKNELILQHTATGIETFCGPEELAPRIRNDLFRWHFDHHLTYHCANTAIGNINIAVEGNRDLRLEIGSEHGAILHARQTAPESPITTVAKIEAAAPGGLLGRDAETAEAERAVEQGAPVVFHGPAGAGKSAMLQWLAHRKPQRPFPDGAVWIDGAGVKSLNDLFQLLFDAFFESEARRKCTDADPEAPLSAHCALVLLDGVEIADEEIERAIWMLPACAFAIGSERPRSIGFVRQIELRGLAPEKGFELFSREMGRALKSDEAALAHGLCERLEWNPRRLLSAAALARENPFVLTALAEMESRDEIVEWMSSRALALLTEHEKRVAALLGAANGAAIAATTISTLTGVPGVAPILESLRRRQLIEARGERHRLCEPLREFLPRVWDLSDWRQRLFDHAIQWAEEHRRNPKRAREEWEVAFALPDWTRAAVRAPEVMRLGLALDPSLALGGQWDLWAEALLKILLAARLEDDRVREAWALHQIGTRALCLGETDDARRLLSEALELRVSLGEHPAASITRHNLDFLLPRGEAQHQIEEIEDAVEVAATDPFPAEAGAASASGDEAARETQVIPVFQSDPPPSPPEGEEIVWPRSSRRFAAAGVAALLILIGGLAVARFRSRPVPIAEAAASPGAPTIATPPANADFAAPSPSPDVSPTPALPANVPQLIVSTDLLTFDPVEQGRTARARLAIKNGSAVPLVISDVKLIGANAADFKLARNCSRRIGARRDCAIDLVFSPRQPGERQAALLIASNAGASPRYVALRGDATAPAPRLEAAPGKVDFGLSVNRAASSQEILTLRNAGSSPLTIDSLSLGNDAFLFNDIDCRGRALNAGETCSISLSFRPKNDGDYNSTLIVQSNARNNPLNVPLEGRRQLIVSRTPDLAAYPNQLRLSFTGRSWNDRKLTRGLIRLTNQGEAPLTLKDVGIDGPNAGSFQLAHKCKGASLTSGAHCDIEVVFAPGQQLSVVEHRARVVATINESATLQTVILNGSVSAQR
jgi:hypothetical protein